MELKDLFENLTVQWSNLETMLEAVQLKQQAIINSDYENLERAMATEERTLSLIQQCEKGRISIISELYSAWGISFETPRLAEFAEKAGAKLDKKNNEYLLQLEKSLKELMHQIAGINRQNMYLVESSRAFIRETMSSLLNSKTTLLDKKV